jgi:poly-gamma-glutamate synthesis protein (capsule biosynthesis protein)
MKKLFLALLFFFALLFFTLRVAKTDSMTIFIVGDILLDRGVGEKIEAHGPDYPYLKVKNILPKADIVFGNLECPITSTGIPALKKPYYLFKAHPNNSDALSNSGFTVLNLANNHTMDYGREGIMNTIAFLEKSGIKTVGAGKDKNIAHKPLYMEVSGTTIGFLSLSAFPTEGYVFSAKKPDVAQLDIEALADEVKSAKVNCDVLIVSFHWGTEFENYPTQNQKQAAYISVENGADLVIGHHPHVLQGMEYYTGTPIFYSLGNFVFDNQEPIGTDETIILKVVINDKSIKNLQIAPIKIVKCQPTIPENTNEATEIFSNFEKYSNFANSKIEIDKENYNSKKSIFRSVNIIP